MTATLDRLAGWAVLDRGMDFSPSPKVTPIVEQIRAFFESDVVPLERDRGV